MPPSCVGVGDAFQFSQEDVAGVGRVLQTITAIWVRVELRPAAHCFARRAERSDEGSEVEGFRGRHHCLHGRSKQGAGRLSREGSDINKKGGRREDSEVVVHGGVEGKNKVIAKRSFKNAAKEKERLLRPALKR